MNINEVPIMTDIHILFKKSVWGLMIACLGMIAPDPVAAADALPETAPGELSPDQRSLIMENGALYYLRAMEARRPAQTPEQAAVLAYIREQLPPQPPTVFNIRTDVAGWLVNETDMVSFLSRALQAPYCLFPIRTPGSPDLRLSHLLPMRRLGLHLLQMTKAYEFTENDAEAGKIFMAQLAMMSDLAEDRNLTSMQAASVLLQDGLETFEGFISRTPPAPSLEPILGFFRSVPEFPFTPAQYLEDEAERYIQWLTEESGTPLQRIESLYGDLRPQPGTLALAPLDEAEQRQRLGRWIEGYRERMQALAREMEKPYLIGLGPLQDLDQQLEKVRSAAPGDVNNPLIPLLVPIVTPTFERYHLARGQYIQYQLMAQAARYHDLIREWPKNLKALQTFMNEELPIDPFSGNPIFYRLRRDGPQWVLRVPKWMAREQSLVHRIDLGERRKRDDQIGQNIQRQAVQGYIRDRQNEPTVNPDLDARSRPRRN